MMKRTISGMTGTGSLAHTRRDFIAEDVNQNRVYLNICYRDENLKDVYKELFDESVERYNVGKRNDRKITNYYDKIQHGKQEKLFHEVIFQIGNNKDMAAGTPEGDLAVKVLDEYMQDFQRRNPTLRVFCCYLHQDEATPHVMFGTVIIDAYRKEEALEMADAIDDLCSPTDNYGWASAGIYCFWDYYAEAVLYIGLAGDLAERFKQHNGILPIKEGSKQKQIEDYFSRNERLGYTIFVQSPLSQPLVHRNRKVYEKFAKQQNSPIEDMLSEQGRDDIKRVEGILIESFRRKYGHFPLWNSMGGSMVGQTKVMENNINIVNSFCQPDNYAINPIVSRSTIRELSRNPEWEWYENYLHAARMNLLILGMEYDEALEFINKNDTLGTYERMKKSGYLRKRLIV